MSHRSIQDYKRDYDKILGMEGDIVPNGKVAYRLIYHSPSGVPLMAFHFCEFITGVIEPTEPVPCGTECLVHHVKEGLKTFPRKK